MRRSLPNILALLASLVASAPLCAQGNFAGEIDLQPLSEIAVHTKGRLKSFGSHANSMMNAVTGPRKIDGRDPLYTYLDMLFRPDVYEDADVIYVKNKAVRRAIAEQLERVPAAAGRIPDLAERMKAFEKTGLTSARILIDPALSVLLGRMKADLIRTNEQVVTLESATVVMKPEILIGQLRVLPPPGDSHDVPWRSIRDVLLMPVEIDGERRLRPQPTLEGLDPEQQDRVARSWHDLYTSWVEGDSAGVNAASIELNAQLAGINPVLYPERSRLAWESWYFRNHQLTRIWLVYMFSVILLLLGVVYQWKWARWSGLTVFGIALCLQTFAVALRWYISGRWPNANMFESVTTAAWFGSVCAVLFELLVRRTGMRSIFALAAASASMVALMAVSFLPVYLNPNIENVMPVLHDIWLYIHTNVIIFSYCLIFMAAVSALLYLLNRMLGGAQTYARVGGAGSLVMGTGAGGAAGGKEAPRARRGRLGEVLDGVTMLLMELSFVLLWTGLVMGAIWADHSWGRPWGWDPKEVFALNTFLVFAILIHVRYKARDKGFWTACLALIGAGVMLFNWIVINFVITGLHSYA